MDNISNDQFTKIVDELSQFLDTSDAINECCTILDILGVPYDENDIDLLT
jgi:hypothetical protein